jgi:hypothetical protein
MYIHKNWPDPSSNPTQAGLRALGCPYTQSHQNTITQTRNIVPGGPPVLIPPVTSEINARNERPPRDFEDREAANHNEACCHVCVHHSGREDSRAYVHKVSAQTQEERQRRGHERSAASSSDKSRVGRNAARHGGHGVLCGAPRRRTPPRRPALRSAPAAQQRLPASPPDR